MLRKFRSSATRHRVHLWDHVAAGDWGETLETLETVAGMWRRYQAAEIDDTICDNEDMIGSDSDAREGYRQVGLSALRIFSEAMVVTGRTRFDDILDLPCGGGRVTRHLRPFFPEARIHVADIDRDKQAAVMRQFGAEAFAFPHDFRGDPERGFDLIFCGSLLTHFDEGLFGRAFDFLIRALNPKGIAALTVHGRSSASLASEPAALARLKEAEREFRKHIKQVKRKYDFNIDSEKAILTDFRDGGFGYFATPAWTEMYGQSYGGSYSSPAWLMRLVEKRPDCTIVGYKERSYGNIQDVVLLQKI